MTVKLVLFKATKIFSTKVDHFSTFLALESKNIPKVFLIKRSFSIPRDAITVFFHTKSGVLKNVAKFIGKHLCQSLFLIQLRGKSCNFIKKETLAQVFSWEFCDIFMEIHPVSKPCSKDYFRCINSATSCDTKDADL